MFYHLVSNYLAITAYAKKSISSVCRDKPALLDGPGQTMFLIKLFGNVIYPRISSQRCAINVDIDILFIQRDL